MGPEISVCVPTFNGAAHIRECLDSILAQTVSDFEILVIDDSSSDGTAEIVEAYARRDPRFHVLRNQRNLGQGGVPSWNRCFARATGDWVKFVFQDDLIAPDCLRVLTDARPWAPGLVFGDRDFILERGSGADRRDRLRGHRDMLRSFYGMSGVIRGRRFRQLLLEHLGMNLVGEPTTVLLHRGLIERFGVFNPYIINAAPSEYWARIVTNIGAVWVDAELALIRVHGASTPDSHEAGEFRTEVLDPLILLHEYAFHPAYDSLRALARHQRPPIHLENKFWDAALEARRRTRRLSRSPDTAARMRAIAHDWAELSAAYPRLRHLLLRRSIDATRRAIQRLKGP